MKDTLIYLRTLGNFIMEIVAHAMSLVLGLIILPLFVLADLFEAGLLVYAKLTYPKATPH